MKKDGEYFEIGKKCECEAKIRAFMRVLRIAEGTGEYIKGTKTARDPQLGYTTWFSGSGNNFTLSDDHPRTINCNSTKSLCSSAAGAYQIMSWTYDELNGYLIEKYGETYRTVTPKVYNEKDDRAKKYNAKGFIQISQDRLCVIILKRNGVIEKLLKNDIRGAIAKAANIWVSLPGGTTGQPTAKMKETLDYYDEFLKKELAEDSYLHIKKGFLKEFDIKCGCIDNSECTEDKCVNYADVVPNPQISNANGGKINNRFNSEGGRKNPHRGVDIHTGDNKVDVHSLLCGEVVYTVSSFNTNEYNSSSLGNLVVVKSIDKDDQTIYIMYCHLDSVKVIKGNKVKHNDILGISGSTGNAGSVFDEKGNLIHGIYPKYYHIHIEAAINYIADSATFKNVASSRVNPENYMKTKFDSNGDKI
ncbi:putative peptidase [Flavobacterium columnare]|nr:putative peptidase [Flavobacterium columnare]